jgi:hypothetical protein
LRQEAALKPTLRNMADVGLQSIKGAAMSHQSLATAPRRKFALPLFLDPLSLRQAMAEGPAGASGPDVDAKAQLLSMAAIVLSLPLLVIFVR